MLLGETMGDASRVKLALAEEITFGTNPGTGFNLLRFNSESLRLDIGNVQSRQIDPTRQPSANIRVNLNASGGIVSEDSLVTPAATPIGFDLLIEGALMTDFSTLVALTAQDINITAVSGATFTVSDPTSSGVLFTDVMVGDWIKMAGFAVNGTVYAHVLTKASANSITAEGVRSTGAAVVNESGQTNVSLNASTAKIGTTKKSYTIERQYSDLVTPEYSLYTGMRVNRWGLRLNAQAIFEHTFDFLGKLQSTLTTSGAGSPAAVWSTPILQAVDHFKMQMLGSFGPVTTVRISEISFDLNNNLRTEPELGVLGSTDIGVSTPTLNGTVRGYMQNADLIRLAEAGTRSKLAFRIDDGTRARILAFPSVLFGTPEAFATGNDASVSFSLPFSCEADSLGVAFSVTRF